MTAKLHSRSQIGLFAIAVVLFVPWLALGQGGRHVSPTDQPPAGQQGPAQAGYGRATIYRSGEMPKPAEMPDTTAKPGAARNFRPADGRQLESPLPEIIRGVPHRFHRHYSQTTC